MTDSEFAFIDWIRSRTAAHANVALGIGDDAALLQNLDEAGCLVAVDMVLEGVHFAIPPATPRLAGRKALAVNLSDVAAMAARPIAAFTSVAFPRSRQGEFAREVQAGIEELAAEFSTAIAGGDTNAWDGPLVISVTVIGEAAGGRVVGRSGARPGDWILTTGEFGASLIGKHLEFQPRVRESLLLHELASLHAMIDVSDGLVADLQHILEESDVGAVLQEDAIPVSEAARGIGDARTPLEHALYDGEDFELLLTVDAADGRKLLANPPVEVKLSHIGEITDSRICELVDCANNRKPLQRGGWEHAF